MKPIDVDPVKCPRLYAALQRERERRDAAWKRVQELRREGRDQSAQRVVKQILGVKRGPPMSEEKKEELAEWKAEHKDEIKGRQQQEREIRKRTIALLTIGKRKKR
jgi:hypothetical protein